MVQTFPACKSIEKGRLHGPCVVQAVKGKGRVIITRSQNGNLYQRNIIDIKKGKCRSYQYEKQPSSLLEQSGNCLLYTSPSPRD